MTDNMERLIILGAAGRDFHDFMTYWSVQPNVIVQCFTGTQIVSNISQTYVSFDFEVCSTESSLLLIFSLALTEGSSRRSFVTMIRMGIDTPMD
jgi:hypothetical protein